MRKHYRKKLQRKKLKQFLKILILIVELLANLATILELFGIKL